MTPTLYTVTTYASGSGLSKERMSFDPGVPTTYHPSGMLRTRVVYRCPGDPLWRYSCAGAAKPWGDFGHVIPHPTDPDLNGSEEAAILWLMLDLEVVSDSF